MLISYFSFGLSESPLMRPHFKKNILFLRKLVPVPTSHSPKRVLCAQHDGAAPDRSDGRKVQIAGMICHHKSHQRRRQITDKPQHSHTAILCVSNAHRYTPDMTEKLSHIKIIFDFRVKIRIINHLSVFLQKGYEF